MSKRAKRNGFSSDGFTRAELRWYLFCSAKSGGCRYTPMHGAIRVVDRWARWARELKKRWREAYDNGYEGCL